MHLYTAQEETGSTSHVNRQCGDMTETRVMMCK